MTTRTWSAGFAMMAALASGPAPAAAQVKAGPEFLVNTYTLGDQYQASVAADGRGRFVTVWTDRADGMVKGQLFDRGGARLGDEFVASSATGAFPEVALRPDRGSFVVAWRQNPGLIFVRRYDETATALGAPVQVSSGPVAGRPNAAVDGKGNFVVAWQGDDGDHYGVLARSIDSAGTPRGGEFLVNTYTTQGQAYPDVAVTGDGSFVVVWTSSDGSPALTPKPKARRFDAASGPVGAEFSLGATGVVSPNVAAAPDGGLAVAVSAFTSAGSTNDILLRRFDATGNQRGSDFVVNTTTAGSQTLPRISADVQGDLVVSWRDYNDGNLAAVRARRLRSDGTPRGNDFLVNTYTPGNQFASLTASHLGVDAVGNFVLGWSSPQIPGGGTDVYAQRFGGVYPDAVQVDAAGNGVFEAGEAVAIRPTWRNLGGGLRTFAATIESFAGPAGPAYTITDGVGDYGTLADGATRTCTDCYVLQVDGSRPAAHWDAVAVESLTPDTLGQRKSWTLHVGGSFTDVPAGNPFYKFVETLLHFSVTGGCGPGLFCPAGSTTRAQMAVFVLGAKEGAGYTPPACTTPMFNDVPAASPFCRFVEELARRGVASGCGGGAYCPDAPVTREQMAVFVLRTLDPTLDPPACVIPPFGDVPTSSPFCRWIVELVRRGVVSGCGGGSYCAAEAVTRQQMGVFISVTFGLVLYGP